MESPISLVLPVRRNSPSRSTPHIYKVKFGSSRRNDLSGFSLGGVEDERRLRCRYVNLLFGTPSWGLCGSSILPAGPLSVSRSCRMLTMTTRCACQSESEFVFVKFESFRRRSFLAHFLTTTWRACRSGQPYAHPWQEQDCLAQDVDSIK